MAFDWRLRIGLGVSDDPSATTAYPGWCQVRDVLVGRDPLADAVLASDRMVQDHNPVAELFDAAQQARGDIDRPRDEMQLARIAVALARYESCYRGGVHPDDPLLPLGAAAGLPALLSLCPGAAADEIARLTAAARRGLAPLFPAESIELNPDFTAHGTPADGSSRLGTATQGSGTLRWGARRPTRARPPDRFGRVVRSTPRPLASGP